MCPGGTSPSHVTARSEFEVAQSRKEILFKMTYSIHLIYGYMALEGRNENVLFNDTLNTFYLWLYDVGHMVKHHSDSDRGNPLLPHGLLFLINTPTGRIAHTSHRALLGM